MALDALDKALIELLADGLCHSGTALAERLDISRAAIWKHIRALESLGLAVSALPGRGYRLLSPVELLSEETIRKNLTPLARDLIGPLELHDELDSTNSHLMRRAQNGAETGTVYLAEFQRAGRGRIGREWISPFGANLYLSILWRFENPAQISGLSLAIGVAAVRALKSLELPGISLKWPNDLLWEGAKLGGILLEVAGEAHGQYAVIIGLGMNRYIPEMAATAIDQPWTDLGRIAGGPPPPRNSLVAALLNELLPLLSDYSEQGLAPFLPEWRVAHAYSNFEATLHVGDARIEGRIVDVTEEGLLILRDEEGRLRQFASGDVRLRVKPS